MTKETGFDKVVSLSMPIKKYAAKTEEGIIDIKTCFFTVITWGKFGEQWYIYNYK